MGKIWFTKYPNISTTFDDLIILRPELLKGWWSYEQHGKKQYEAGDARTPRQLGTKMYFHVEVKDIKAGEKLEMQLYDFDSFIFDGLDRDTDEFPEEPVTKEATVKETDGRFIASVGVDLRDSWAAVIGDELDEKIELYWDVAYTDPRGNKIEESLPKAEDEYLQVTFNDRDLFLLPAAGLPNGLPEIYDSKGNLIVFALKAGRLALRDVADAPLQTFVATRIRVINTRQLLPELNAIKKEIHTRQINLNTNTVTLDLKYSVTEEVNFLVKSKGSLVDVTETTTKTAKKFSDYFNLADTKAIGIKLAKAGTKLLMVLDFIQMTRTVYGILPKEAGEPLNVPSPASVSGMVNLVVLSNSTALAGSALGNAAAPVALAFATADIVAAPMVKGLMADIMEDGKLFLARALLQGLPAVDRYLSTDSAKVCKYRITDTISQKTHEKLMSGLITTLEQLRDSKFEDSQEIDIDLTKSSQYLYVYQIVTNPHSKLDLFIINAIITI